MKRIEIQKKLEQKRSNKKNITATIDEEKFKQMKDLAKNHGVSFSSLLEICIDIGLEDETIRNKTK